ncbi:hypothetical protein GTP41_10420 [Pseudoduganella sp. DS3]|uniref:Uncharacterized protein n=1 Tax=Pseudoduganella guangdongensis TaxID=2692179 RepID=A0A6N9HHK4_9BURK|nr:hypothetical protein [Pseudoduganella guangdongensis]MYN02512.1 hypothetical protein [Pseudoduganella guangdongensis]
MLVMVLRQTTSGRLRVIWLARLNYAILFQFAAMLVIWLVIAATGDRDFYYFITWTSLPLFVLAAIVPWFSRSAAGSAKPRQPQ